uniref:flagellar protein FlhE n=1 Tax=Alcaligenes faecalis TaxID=511 RepID=UPI003D021E22
MKLIFICIKTQLMSLLKTRNYKKPVFINSFLNPLFVFMALGSFPAIGHSASLAWDGEQLSNAITTSSPRTQQSFMPPEAIRSQASTLGKVEVSYDHNGRAVLKSRLCLQGGSCVDMNGSVLSTRAFAGQDARHGFVLEHEVWSWAGSTEAVRVRASIRVNYQR